MPQAAGEGLSCTGGGKTGRQGQSSLLLACLPLAPTALQNQHAARFYRSISSRDQQQIFK